MNTILAGLFASAFVFIQCYISGSRPAFYLPPFAIIGLAGMLSLCGARKITGRIWPACAAAIAVWFTYILARNRVSPIEYLARHDFYTALACLVTYGLTIRYFDKPAIRRAIVAVMLALAAIEVLLGLWQFSHADEFMPFGLIRSPGASRASGMYISSIHFAGFLEGIAPFALAIATWGSRSKVVKVTSISIALLCYFGILVSGSRGGWLSAVFSLTIFAVIALKVARSTNKTKLPAIIYLGIIAIIAASAGLAALANQSDMLSARMDLVSQIGSVAENEKAPAPYDVRVYNWQAAIDQWNSAPLFGTGGGTHLYLGRLHRRPQIQSDPEHAHGDYLELLAEYGIIGAIGMVVFLITHIGSGLANLRALIKDRLDHPYSESPQLAFNIGALVAVSSYLAHSAVDFNLHLPGNALLFAFIFGIIATRYQTTEQEPETGEPAPTPMQPAMGFALFSLGAILAAYSTLRTPSEYWSEKSRVALRDGFYEQAATTAGRGLETDPKNPFLYYNLGQSRRLQAVGQTGDQREALLSSSVTAFRAGIAIFPHDENLWLRLGQALDASGRFEEARTSYITAISLDPNLGILHAHFAIHLYRIGREAEAQYEETQARKFGGPDTYKLLNDRKIW